MIWRATQFVSLLCLAGVSVVFGQGGQPVHASSLRGGQSSSPLAVSVNKDQTVQYGIQMSSSYIYGASVHVQGFNPEGMELFRISPFVPRTGTHVTLPAGSGHLVPYRGTLHEVGRPSYLTIRSLNEPDQPGGLEYDAYWFGRIDRKCLEEQCEPPDE